LKRLLIILCFILLLSGCHSGEFHYSQSQINLETQLSEVISMMMEEGNYDDDLMVPYSRASLYINYSSYKVVVESVQFQVFRKIKGEEYHNDATLCFDVDGRLSCREDRGMFTSDKRIEEVSLKETMDTYAKIDIEAIIFELKSHYNISLNKTILAAIHLVSPQDIEDEQSKLDNVAYYYDNTFHYDTDYEPSEMMVEVKIHFRGEDSGELCVLYMSIE